jgi:hypothetical protein
LPCGSGFNPTGLRHDFRIVGMNADLRMTIDRSDIPVGMNADLRSWRLSGVLAPPLTRRHGAPAAEYAAAADGARAIHPLP